MNSAKKGNKTRHASRTTAWFTGILLLTYFGEIGVRPLASAQESNPRLLHARELLGKHYERSIVSESEGIRSEDVTGYIRASVRKRLPEKYRSGARRIASTIVRESRKHGFDPLFVMAVIENESSFKPEKLGSHGEIGLMQILPTTAEWYAKKAGLKFRGKKGLYDPVRNIELGTHYLSYLRESFDAHSRLYLSAYNMGGANVCRALAKDIWPKDYVQAVMKHYVAFYTELTDEDGRSLASAN